MLLRVVVGWSWLGRESPALITRRSVVQTHLAPFFFHYLIVQYNKTVSRCGRAKLLISPLQGMKEPQRLNVRRCG